MPDKNNILNKRNKINEIDKQILDLLNDRAEISLDIRELKKAADIAIYDSTREEEVVETLCKENNGKLSDENIRDLFFHIMKIMRGLPDRD